MLPVYYSLLILGMVCMAQASTQSPNGAFQSKSYPFKDSLEITWANFMGSSDPSSLKSPCDFLSSANPQSPDQYFFYAMLLTQQCPEMLTKKISNNLMNAATSSLTNKQTSDRNRYFAVATLAGLKQNGAKISSKKTIIKVANSIAKKKSPFLFPLLAAPLATFTELSAKQQKVIQAMLNQNINKISPLGRSSALGYLLPSLKSGNTYKYAKNSAMLAYSLSELDPLIVSSLLSQRQFTGLFTFFSELLQSSSLSGASPWATLGLQCLSKLPYNQAIITSSTLIPKKSNKYSLEVLFSQPQIDISSVSATLNGETIPTTFSNSPLSISFTSDLPGSLIVEIESSEGAQYSLSHNIKKSIRLNSCTLAIEGGITHDCIKSSSKITLDNKTDISISFDATIGNSSPQFATVIATETATGRYREFIAETDGSQFFITFNTLSFFPQHAYAGLVKGMSRKTHSDVDRDVRATKAIGRSLSWASPSLPVRHAFFGDSGDAAFDSFSSEDEEKHSYTLRILLSDPHAESSKEHQIADASIVTGPQNQYRHGYPQDYSRSDPLSRHDKDRLFEANAAAPLFEIHHVFNQHSKRVNSIIVAIAWRAIAAFPLIYLGIALFTGTVNFGHFGTLLKTTPLSFLSSLVFFTTLAGILYLYYLYWLKLTFFTMLQYLGTLLCILLPSGYAALKGRTLVR